eukprot:Gb_17637 [translate_table: standard]
MPWLLQTSVFSPYEIPAIIIPTAILPQLIDHNNDLEQVTTVSTMAAYQLIHKQSCIVQHGSSNGAALHMFCNTSTPGHPSSVPFPNCQRLGIIHAAHLSPEDGIHGCTAPDRSFDRLSSRIFSTAHPTSL